MDTNPVTLDGTGRDGPPYRHIGDHPDLYWIDRGDSTRVRIGQVRALRQKLGMGSFHVTTSGLPIQVLSGEVCRVDLPQYFAILQPLSRSYLLNPK